MKKQTVRKTFILISFLLFPITIFYLSPYLIIQAGLKGIVSGSFVTFGSLFLGSLFWGRAFCGWVCPAGGLQECCAAAVGKKAKGGRLNWIKYLIWLPWLVSVIAVFVGAGGIKKLDLFYSTDHGVSVSGLLSYIPYLGVVALIVSLSLAFGKRSFCHYVCWMAPLMTIGSQIKNKLGYPSLHLEADGEKCVHCKLCNQKCPMSLDVHEMVRQNKLNHPECILCGECVDSCGKKAIGFRFTHQ
ncbi:4Fe-4S binding protein [Hydrogenispora ethanolica]|uniref:4Fe-4S binding protein n=1 Tax=Hydrogenispora ethanolica TaxID=1082276 RepID=A0A4R1SBQ5_HYDET|nr:4Fe-4S binding protein [Hydrogenispora ethanolica]TCL76993.1 4Fe-4S binding protein [Hydrogenispora ethanolica]